MPQNIPNMMKSIYLHIPIVQPIPSRINRGEPYTDTSEMLKTENRKCWSTKRNLSIHYKYTIYISAETMMLTLFTIAKTWKQPKCPLTEENLRKYGTYIQWTITQPLKRMKKCHLQLYGWMELEIVILSEVWQSEIRQRMRNIIWHHLYVEYKKNLYKGTYL